MTFNRNNVILLFGNNVPGHTTKAPQVGFELATKCIQFYAIANLDKTSLINILNNIFVHI